MNQTLNDAQRKLVEDNHNLIYSFLNNHHLSLDAIEDWYGVAAIGLCKAAMAFDETRETKFTTLAYICMENEVRLLMKKNRNSITVIASLDEEISGTDGCRLCDSIADPVDPFYSIYLSEAINLALCDTNDRDKMVLRLFIEDGLTQKDISAKVGIARSTVSTIYTAFLKKIRDYLYN